MAAAPGPWSITRNVETDDGKGGQLIASDRAIRRGKVVPLYMTKATRLRRNHAKVETHWGTPEDEGGA